MEKISKNETTGMPLADMFCSSHSISSKGLGRSHRAGIILAAVLAPILLGLVFDKKFKVDAGAQVRAAPIVNTMDSRAFAAPAFAKNGEAPVLADAAAYAKRRWRYLLAY